MQKRKVIIDTDPGIDDALAIMAAFKDPDIEVLGLTTVSGNKGLETVTDNACRLSSYFNAAAPVYKGAESRLLELRKRKQNQKVHAEGIHGANGLGGVRLPLDETVLQEQQAVDFILETVKDNPGEVDIIALGPLTNSALCIEKDIETMKQVRSIHTMGGGVYKGNCTPVAEFNYWFDPEAADMLYEKLGEFVPLHMIGLDVTHQAVVTPNDVLFMKYIGGDLGLVISRMLEDYFESYWVEEGYIGTVIHDLMAVVGYKYPEIYSDVHHCRVRCVTDSDLAGGQTVVDLHNQFGGNKNAYVPMKADSNLYKQKMIRLLFGEEAEEKYLSVFEKRK